MAHYSYPASEAIETVRSFVNTVHHEQGQVEEQLHSPDALAAYLRERGLLDERVGAKPADLRRALELREAIRRLLEANNGMPLDRDAVALLNRAAARARVVAAFEDNSSWRVEPAARGIDGALGRLIANVLRAMSEPGWSRLKACGNPDCRWAFFDASKNQSGRWCEMASCGNRMKARRFRERARASGAR